MKGEHLAAAVLALATTHASSEPPAARPDPADPKAEVATIVYRSAFDGYRKHAEEKVDSWKAVNDNVGRIGGWRVYLKEAQQPDAPAPPPQAKPAQPAPKTPTTDDHRGHRAH